MTPISATAECQARIIDLIPAGETVEGALVRSTLADEGFSRATVYRAADRLGISYRLLGFGADKRAIWTRP